MAISAIQPGLPDLCGQLVELMPAIGLFLILTALAIWGAYSFLIRKRVEKHPQAKLFHKVVKVSALLLVFGALAAFILSVALPHILNWMTGYGADTCKPGFMFPCPPGSLC
jgi:drug/metabolite transporter (DMT)-like permease